VIGGDAAGETDAEERQAHGGMLRGGGGRAQGTVTYHTYEAYMLLGMAPPAPGESRIACRRALSDERPAAGTWPAGRAAWYGGGRLLTAGCLLEAARRRAGQLVHPLTAGGPTAD
jgi:hypothetical protein